MEEVSYAASAAMSEAEYLRWALGVLGWIVAALFVWIYKGDQSKIQKSNDAIAKKLDERDAAVTRRFDAQDRVLDGMREAQFEEGQSFREFFHQHDKRIDRLEQEDARRSKQTRRGDG